MGWTITPNNGLASISSNGKVTFSEHTEAVTYRVRYSDSDCSDWQDITVRACPTKCKCEDVDLHAESAGGSVPAAGYSSSTLIGTYDGTTCLTDITASSDKTWVTDVSANNGNVYAKVKQNTSITNTRTATITVSGVDEFGETCQDTFTVTQEMSASTCTCDNVDLRAAAVGGPIPAVGYSTAHIIGTYDNTTCLSGITASSDKTWVTIASVSNGYVYAEVDSNFSTTSGRNATITVSGKDAYNNTCNDPFIIVQEKSGDTCTCDVFEVYDGDGCVPSSGGSSINIGTYNDGNCIRNVGATSLPNWITSVSCSNGTIVGTIKKNSKTTDRETVIAITGRTENAVCIKDLFICQKSRDCACEDFSYERGNNEFDITAATNVQLGTITIPSYCDSSAVTFVSSDSSVVTNIRVSGSNVIADLPALSGPDKADYTMYVNGTPCNIKAQVKRMCFCGTDNCTQGDVYNHPLHIDSVTCWCNNGVINYDGIGTKITSDHTGDHFFVRHGELLFGGNVPADGQILWNGNDSWVYGVYSTGTCPSITYYCTTNTGSAREAIFRFATKENSVISSDCVNPPASWIGHYACRGFEVIIKQAAAGYWYDRVGVDPKTGDSTYIQKPISGLCGSAPTTYTYTVNSNVEGATVQFWNSSSQTILYDTKTIQNGTCSTVLEFNTVYAVAFKTGCIMTNPYEIMTNGGTADLDGVCNTSSCDNAPEPTISPSVISGDSTYDVTRFISCDLGDCWEIYGVSGSNAQIKPTFTPGATYVYVLLETTDAGSSGAVDILFRKIGTETTVWKSCNVVW